MPTLCLSRVKNTAAEREYQPWASLGVKDLGEVLYLGLFLLIPEGRS